jgi:hypothetical protein
MKTFFEWRLKHDGAAEHMFLLTSHIFGTWKAGKHISTVTIDFITCFYRNVFHKSLQTNIIKTVRIKFTRRLRGRMTNKYVNTLRGGRIARSQQVAACRTTHGWPAASTTRLTETGSRFFSCFLNASFRTMADEWPCRSWRVTVPSVAVDEPRCRDRSPHLSTVTVSSYRSVIAAGRCRAFATLHPAATSCDAIVSLDRHVMRYLTTNWSK